jgi:hypothetical protein
MGARLRQWISLSPARNFRFAAEILASTSGEQGI